jgi:hypothetical protein
MREEYSRSGINYDGIPEVPDSGPERCHIEANAGTARSKRVHSNPRVWTIDCRIPAE